MRVALIGGTGFVGGYLVDALLDTGHEVSLLVRHGSEGKVHAEVWRTISGDISDFTSAGHVRMSPVHVEDVSRAFVNALTDDTTIGKTYELGGPEVLSWSDMIGRVAKAVDRDKRVLPVPVGLMKIGATLLDWLPVFPVTRDQLMMLAEGNTADPSIVESLIGRPPAAFTPDRLSYISR